MNEHSLGRRSFLAMGLSAAIVAVGGCSGGGGGTSSAAKKASDIKVKEVVIGTAADSTGPAPAVSGARTGGAVKIINSADFDHLDPQAMFKGYTQTAAELFTRKLTGYKEQDGKLVLVGDLATDTGATTDGGKTWEYTLKDGIKFQDGTAITSADIKYGIERSYEPTIVAAAGPSYIQSWLSGGRWAGEYKGPWKGDSLPDSVIETPDDKTIVFHLREAVTTFPYAAALPTTSPVAKELDTKARYDRMPVSTGPYKIESHDDTSMTLVRNEHWDPSTDPIRHNYPDTFSFEFGQDPEQISQQLIASAGDDVNAMTIDAPMTGATLQDYAAKRELQARGISEAAAYTYYANINTKRITNPKVRQAIMTAFPRKQIVQNMGGSAAGIVATTLMSPAVYGWADHGAMKDIPESGNTAAAKKLLEESGERNPTIVYGYQNTEIEQTNSVTIKQALEKAGFKVVLKPIDEESYLQATQTVDGDYDLYIGGWGADWPDGSGVIPALFDGSSLDSVSSSTNYSKYNNRAVNEAIAAATKITDADQAARAWVALDKQITRDAPAVPIYYRVRTYVYGSNLGGVLLGSHYATSPLNVYVKG